MTKIGASPHVRLTAAEVASAAQLACLLEASAPKPGNVSPGRHFADVRYEDFLASAVAIGDPLSAAGVRGLGATVRLAIEATARWVPSNTNLGIVLLLAPLARAALTDERVGRFLTEETRPGVPAGADPTHALTVFVDDLRDAVRRVLAETSVDDAREAYAAIRLAAPGGLGEAPAQDVRAEPTATLLRAMQLAADRDAVAREYATAFEVTFETGAPTLSRARDAGLAWDDAIVETFLVLLAARPDTHITRRGGPALAAHVSRLAAAVLRAGGVRSPAGRRAIEEMDSELRGPGNARNPGTTADLTAAAVFVALLGGGWKGDRKGF